VADRQDDADTIDGLEMALALGHGSAEARSLIEKQSRLIDAQETLARADLQHRGWQIIGERVGALIKALTALVGILILLGIASFLWSAGRASGMVVDAFTVPPALAAEGLTGTVVATQLLDKVAALEAGAQSARAKSGYEDSWSDTKGVVVPYAGVSLGQIRRELRDWLGNETHLGGELVRLPGDRLAISFRTTTGLSGRVEGPASEPDKLLDAAAQAMFKATQPYRYAVYQSRQGNVAEAQSTLEKLARSDDLHERLWAMHGLALNAPTEAETVAIYQRVLALKPDFLPAVGNMPLYAENAGREEEAYRLSRRASMAYGKGSPDYTPSYAAGFGMDSRSRVAGFKGDLGEAARQAEAAERTLSGGPTFLAARPFLTASAWAEGHDFKRARDALAAAGMLDPERRAAAEKITGAQFSLAELHAIATGDDARLVAGYQRLLAAIEVQNLSRISLGEAEGAAEESARIKRLMAVPLVRLGRIAEAKAALAGQPDVHDQAMRARALLAAYAGDARGSDHLFARAAARTPSRPAANLLWAEALLHRRDFAGAEAQAREAIRRGPNSAEAHRLLGEALMGQRRWADASKALAVAARLTPQWGSIQLRWASALWRLGKRDEARARLAAAAGMALNPADRARLGSMWARATAEA
jgi:TolA-binding protein